jgi:hypothetical protein
MCYILRNRLVIYHSPCCTLGGLSTLNLLNGNAIFAYAAKEGQSLGVESGSGKSKDPVMSKGWIGLVGISLKTHFSISHSSSFHDFNSCCLWAEYLEVRCEDSQRIIREIEDLKSEVDEDLRQLGYCKENEKLRAELAVKVKERHWIEELEAKIDFLRKRTEELEAINDGLPKRNEELQAKNDDLTKQNKELQARNDSLTKGNEELQAKNDDLHKNVSFKKKIITTIDLLHSLQLYYRCGCWSICFIEHIRGTNFRCKNPDQSLSFSIVKLDTAGCEC